MPITHLIKNHQGSFVLILLLLSIGITSCRDRYSDIAKNGSVQLHFSSDTVRLDTLYSDLSSATFGVMVYNRNEKAILLDEVQLLKAENKNFRINVDGRSGHSFHALTLPAQDSIFIFIEGTFPQGEGDAPQLIEDDILFRFHGREKKIHLEGWRENTSHFGTLHISSDTIITAQRPLLIRDSLVVHEGFTLTLEAGTHLLLGDKAHISVYGSLIASGKSNKRILIEGIRRDNLIPEVSYLLLPGQWDFIYFAPSSTGNKLNYTTIRNGRGGVIIKGNPQNNEEQLTLNGCKITNMKGSALSSKQSKITMLNSELSNTLNSTLLLQGGQYNIDFCTIVNLYKWDYRQGTALNVQKGEGAGEETFLHMTNSIVDGSYSVQRPKGNSSMGEIKKAMGGEITFYEKAVTKATFSHCYLRTPLENYPIFTNSIEAIEREDKVYNHTGKNKEKDTYDFKFDFRPLPQAPFVGKAEGNTATDLEGKQRSSPATIGAYEATTEENDKKSK